MKPIMIELFSGSKSISRVFEQNGFDTFSIDIRADLKPSLCSDICHVTPKDIPANPSFIWASPDCTRFSRASSSVHWNKITNRYRVYTYIPVSESSCKSVNMLESTVNLLRFFNDTPFVIENPIGRIQHMQSLKRLGHFRYCVNYADYGFPYSKETYLFSNIWLPFSTKKVHSAAPGLRTIRNRTQRSAVPDALIQTIIDYHFSNHRKNVKQ
jgi:site-specific DNA-cytosine methylase